MIERERQRSPESYRQHFLRMSQETIQRQREAHRVIKGKDLKMSIGADLARAGEGKFGVQWITTPENNPLATMICFIEYIAPGQWSQKHGHQNEAMFYILEGEGYEIHDGVRYDWEAGDIVIVPAGCVHQHFNASAEKPARALVINPKPLYFFLDLVRQRMVEPPPE